jgi:uncharacterized protein YdiU (UPF0061 family)
MLNFNFINSYSKLPPEFYSFVKPTLVENPAIIKVNNELAHELNINGVELDSKEGVSILSGNTLPQGAMPLAQVYAGHQFGHFNPQLGDGRAILLGDIIDRNNTTRDIQLKGAGPTPYSRGGDGRAAIGPVIREYILSEAMHALGIKTTRALAAVSTGESVYRQTMKPGAIITRIASSHIRIGTFEYFRSQQSTDSIKKLADFVIKRHYPSIDDKTPSPYLQLLNKVIDAQASLVASWMHIGFIHGVMNTDNMSICGETIDYGPCAFMNAYNPLTVFSSIDRDGRYAYGNQSSIALWNLTRFAECLLPLLDQNIENAILQAESCLSEYSNIYYKYWFNGMLAKIGITKAIDEDRGLIYELLKELEIHAVDFTNFFRNLPNNLTENCTCTEPKLETWINRWKVRVQETSQTQTMINNMNQVNPIYIPRNHLVEAAIKTAETHFDYRLMNEMIHVLSQPFTKQAGMDKYNATPPNDQTYRTFCGT